MIFFSRTKRCTSQSHGWYWPFITPETILCSYKILYLTNTLISIHITCHIYEMSTRHMYHASLFIFHMWLLVVRFCDIRAFHQHWFSVSICLVNPVLALCQEVFEISRACVQYSVSCWMPVVIIAILSTSMRFYLSFMVSSIHYIPEKEYVFREDGICNWNECIFLYRFKEHRVIIRKQYSELCNYSYIWSLSI